MTGWRPALRIARRDALRHRGRSILVLVMVALPVLAVSAAAVVVKTAEVTGAEGTDRQMGAAAARIWTGGSERIIQAPDPERQGYSGYSPSGTDTEIEPLDEAGIRTVLGDDVRLLPIRDTWGTARIGERAVDFQVTEIDLTDPLTVGLFDLETGRLPEAASEVVVNDAMLAKGFAVGDDLDLADGTVTIVGAGRHAENRDYPIVLGPAGLVQADESVPEGRDWLVGAGPVTWDDVLALNARGGIVASRAVLANPPDVADLAEQMGYDTGQDELFAVVALIIVMALLEVVLLAGPAFAVGARRQARSLALMAASGGTPAQSRRVILASGLVLGAVASALGLVLGVIAGIALLPAAQRFQGTWFGPVEIPVNYLAAIVVFGLASAFLASVVPAWLASRQDVVAVLAGRRGDRKPRASTPVLGLVMLGAGIAGSSYGAVTSDSGNGAIWMAASAVVSVLGMILVVPVVVALVAKLARKLPLTARYAARDAARHRTRTIPAVAAVAATVAGVVALGIANSSDEHENEATYQPQFAMGQGVIVWSPEGMPDEDPVDPAPMWANVEAIVRDTAPDADVAVVRGVPYEDGKGGYVNLQVSAPGTPARAFMLESYGGIGTQMVVGEDASALALDDDLTATMNAALADGRTVVLTREPVESDEARLTMEVWREDGDEPASKTFTVRATFVTVPDGFAAAQGAMPQSVIDELGLPTVTASLIMRGQVSEAEETAITEAVKGVVGSAYVYVERGYERPDEAVIILLVLFALGGVLMLGGTLTATFLALSDARPDLATLAAVGAAPRTRRAIAAAYALVIGFVGAILGAGVGFIPGIAISRPLTSFSDSGPYLDIPWLMILGLVLVLPLLTAAIVGLSARSRLPLVARLD